MTEEQIKQNAEDYANTRKYTLDELNNSILTVEEIVKLAYITGAHSRDEEVNHWKESYEELAEIADDLQFDKQKLITENTKLTKEVEMWCKS